MRNLYKFNVGDVWFSKNGTKAYQLGERPKFMWPDNSDLIATDTHHIARPFGVGFTRELVMFYKLNKAGGR